MQYYMLLKDMPFHSKGELLVKSMTANVYIWETGTPVQQYAMSAEIVENNSDWFEEVFPNWTQNEPCWFLSFNGMIIHDYFDRAKHSTFTRFGNMFKSKEDAEIALEKIKPIFQPFVDASVSS